uniref:RING-type domain-containing protein n=1 Tax=Pristionchus pacificus TaxID=54126 RepID=A0A8R1YUY4_PRIPA
MRSCRRSLTQYFDGEEERRRLNMACVSVASPTVHGWSSCGYVTCSSLSDEETVGVNGDDERDSLYSINNENREGRKEKRLHPAICPHCNFIYEKPVTLQCGHSLCDHCCVELLSQMDNNSVPRTRPRMGISSYSRASLNKRMTSSWNSLNSSLSLWKSPRCVVCGESPKKSPPVPNLSLRDFLTTIKVSPSLKQLYKRQNKNNESSHDLSLCQPVWHSSESCGVSIRDCLIYIVGWKGVGKSCLIQTQLCNDMLIDELLGRGEGRNKDITFPHSPISDISPLRSEEVQRRGMTYMLKLMETGDISDTMDDSMGVIVTYSVIDRESFHYARRLLSILSTQRQETPLVVIGTKSDLENKRQVESYEGQMVAKQFNCPFLEVSSRRNECVNEAFIELVRVMESRNIFK